MTPAKVLLLGAPEFLGLLDRNPRLGLGVARRLAASDEREPVAAGRAPVATPQPAFA